MSDSHEFLTVAEASERMSVSARVVRELCRQGYLPGAKQQRTGGPWQIPSFAVDAWLDEPVVPPKPLWERGWFVGIAAIVTVLAGIAGFYADSGLRDGAIARLTTPSPTPTTTPLPLLPAVESEALIVITTFHRTEGVVDSAVHDEIRRAIQEKIDDLNLDNVRVAVEPIVIPSANREQAEALGKRYNATLIIWGADSGVRLEINFLNLKEPDFDAAEATISETTRTQLANPEAYNQFVVNELPGQLTYLSLFALAQAEYGQEKYAEAILLLETAVASLSNLAEADHALLQLDAAYFRLGWLYQTTGQMQLAIADYDQAIAFNPEEIRAFNNRGAAYADLGDYDQAIADYNQAIALNPEYALAFYNRGNAYRNLGNYNQAIADYDQAIALNPEEVRAFNNRGAAYADLGDYDQAIADYNQAIALNPEYALAFYNRGNAYYNLGHYDQASADYAQASALDPEKAYAFHNPGNPNVDLGDYDGDITVPSGLSSWEMARMFNNRGSAYADLGDYKRAIADYDQAIAFDPELADAFNNRGNAYHNLDDYVGAIVDYNRAIILNPGFADAFYNRGAAYADLGDYERAIADYGVYLAFSPQSPRREWVENRIRELEAELEN